MWIVFKDKLGEIDERIRTILCVYLPNLSLNLAFDRTVWVEALHGLDWGASIEANCLGWGASSEAVL